MAGRGKEVSDLSALLGKHPASSRQGGTGEGALLLLLWLSWGEAGVRCCRLCGRSFQAETARSGQTLCMQGQHLEVCVMALFYVPGAFGGLVGSHGFALDCLTWSFRALRRTIIAS